MRAALKKERRAWILPEPLRARPGLREIAWAAFCLGALMVIGSVIEIFRLADRQQSLGFASNAGLLRVVVAGEMVIAILAVLVLRALGKKPLSSSAGVVFFFGVIDVIFTAQAGVIP